MKVTVIGLGPGGGADLTGRARAALEACDLIVGYTAYIDLVRADFPQKETLSTGMRREVDRCRAAVEAARTGALEECWGSGTAAVISPVGALRYEDEVMEIGGGGIGPVSQKLYDTVTGIQTGKVNDEFGWTVEVQ